MSRRVVAVCAIAVAVCAVGCPGRNRRAQGPTSAIAYGIYEATYVAPGEASRRFRLQLYAALPDRIHAEVIPPVGGPKLILDGGDGRLAVTLPGRKQAWAGAATGEALERILGFRLRLDALVAAVLEGTPIGDGIEILRSPPGGGELPKRFELALGERRLQLELKRRRTSKGGAGAMGTGSPPPGVDARPLDEMLADEDPLALSED